MTKQSDPDLEALLTASVKPRLQALTTKCKHCGIEFKQNRYWQVFCSIPCRRAFHELQAEAARIRQLEVMEQLERENESLRKQLGK